MLSATSVITDGLGHASVTYTTPANAGTITITASAAGLASKKFSETATTSAAIAMTAFSENKLVHSLQSTGMELFSGYRVFLALTWP